jgi:3D (Asp-Asp-Asp) domain-containing protein
VKFGRFLTAAAACGAAGVVAANATPVAQEPSPPTAQARSVTLVADGEIRKIATNAATVGELLSQEKAALRLLDRCSVPLTTPIRDGIFVQVTRVDKRQVVERVTLPFPTQRRFTPAFRAGIRQVLQPGAAGERVKTVVEVAVDGEVVRRQKIAEAVTPPTPRVEVAGLRGLSLASRGSFEGRRVIEMVATGYGPDARCNGRWGSRTATGRRAGYGVVAVDPRFIPLGTRLYVEGYGFAVAGDTGGAIKGNRIDLGHNSYREALRVGRRRVRVLVLK